MIFHKSNMYDPLSRLDQSMILRNWIRKSVSLQTQVPCSVLTQANPMLHRLFAKQKNPSIPNICKYRFGFFIPFINITIFAQTKVKLILFGVKALKIHCQIMNIWLCDYISNLGVLINYKSLIAQICGDRCFLVPLFCLWRGEVSNYRMVVGNKGNVS